MILKKVILPFYSIDSLLLLGCHSYIFGSVFPGANRTLACSARARDTRECVESRENELRERIPVPHGNFLNLFKGAMSAGEHAL